MFYVTIAKHQCRLLVIFIGPLTWDVFQIIIDIFPLVVSVYVLNQSHGNWLLFNALHVAITMTLKLKEKIGWLI